MADAVKTPNVVEATNKPGLYEKLENMKKRCVPTPVQTREQCRDPSHAPPAGQDEAKTKQKTLLMGSHIPSLGAPAQGPHPAMPATATWEEATLKLYSLPPRGTHRLGAGRK